MPFWENIQNPEPLRQYRWYMYFPMLPNGTGDGLQKFIFALKECSKPSYKIDVSSHVLLNHTFNFPKNLVWNPIKIKMISAVDEKYFPLDAGIYLLLKDSGYTTAKEQTQKQISKKNISFSEIQLYQIDESANIVETWFLSNAFINNVNYGTLNYSSDEMVDIDFDITYDYAEVTTPQFENNAQPKAIQEANSQQAQNAREARRQNALQNVFNLEVSGQGVTANIAGNTIKVPTII